MRLNQHYRYGILKKMVANQITIFSAPFVAGKSEAWEIAHVMSAEYTENSSVDNRRSKPSNGSHDLQLYSNQRTRIRH